MRGNVCGSKDVHRDPEVETGNSYLCSFLSKLKDNAQHSLMTTWVGSNTYITILF
jgi:hypothetical protein